MIKSCVQKLNCNAGSAKLWVLQTQKLQLHNPVLYSKLIYASLIIYVSKEQVAAASAALFLKTIQNQIEVQQILFQEFQRTSTTKEGLPLMSHADFAKISM